MKKDRILWIDQLKGLAFLFVIFGHTAGINTDLKSWVYSFHMPLFFIASGFLLDFGKLSRSSFKEYFLKNFRGLFVPYVWLNFFCIAIRYIMVIFITHKPLNIPGYLRGIALSNTRLEGCPSPSGPTYFILLIALSRLALWLLAKLFRGDRVKIGICCALLTLVSILTWEKNFPWHLNVVPTAMLMIYIGRMMLELYEEYKEKLHSLKTVYLCAVCAVLFALGAVIWKFNGRVSFHGNYYGKSYLLFLLSAVATCTAFALICTRLPELKGISYLGANTLVALGVHDSFIRIAETALKRYKGNMWFSLVETVLLFLLMIPIVFLANRFVPYINGKTLTTKGIATELFKFASVVIAGFGPCNYFINNFRDGLLESTLMYKLLSYGAFVLLCFVVYLLFTKVFRFMFNEVKKEKTDKTEKKEAVKTA